MHANIEAVRKQVAEVEATLAVTRKEFEKTKVRVTEHEQNRVRPLDAAEILALVTEKFRVLIDQKIEAIKAP